MIHTKSFYAAALLFLFASHCLSGAELPVDSGFVPYPAGTVTAQAKDGKLLVTVGKTAKKITYASLLLKFKTPQDWSDFRDVRLNVRSSQKILVKCSFGDFKNYCRINWPRKTAGATEKEFLFERSSFIFPQGGEQLLTTVRQFTIGLGLWQYDTTKETAEIELSGIQVTQPSDVFVIPLPAAGVSIDGTYRDWGHEDALYNWTPPAYVKLDARHQVGTRTKSSPGLSGRYSLMFDDKNIYFLALVADATPKQGQGGGNPWSNDCVELFLANGVKARDLKQSTSIAGKGFQIIFDHFNEKATVFKNGTPVPGIKIPVKFKAESMPVNGKMLPGYVVEAAIPRSLLPAPCTKGSLLAHAVKINDCGGATLCSSIGNAQPQARLLNFGRAYFEFEGKESRTEYKFGKTAEDAFWPEMYSKTPRRLWEPEFCARRQPSQTIERIYLNGFWAIQGGKNIDFSPDPNRWAYVPVPMNVGWATPAFRLTKGKLAECSPNAISSRNSAFWYEREISIPAEWAGRQIFLNLAYITNNAFIYIDKKQAGFISSVKQELNVTKFIKPGMKQRLDILVDGMMEGGIRITGGQGGLAGDVWLEAHRNTPVVKDIWIRKADGVDKSFRFEVTSETGGKVRIILNDPAGKPLVDMSKDIPANHVTVFEGKAGNAPAWSPESPALCSLTVQQFNAGNKLLDERKVNVGFRRFESRNASFLLNGKKVRLRIAFHSTVARVFAPGWLEEMKRLGYNAINLHASETNWNTPLYELLDKKGFLVQAAIPSRNDKDVARRIRQIRNHPCIIGYTSDPFGQLNTNGTIHNPFENDDTYMPSDFSSKNIENHMARRDAIFRQADPERRYIAQATGNWRDYMRSTHHYATNDLNLLDRMMYHQPWSQRKNPKLPLVIHEAGGTNLIMMDTLHPTHKWPAGKDCTILVPRLLVFEAAARYLGDRAFLQQEEWHKMLLQAKYRDYRLNGVDGFLMFVDSDLGNEIINYKPAPNGLGVQDRRQLSYRYFTAPFIEIMEDSWMRVNSWFYRLRALTTYPWGEKYGHQQLKRLDNVYSPLYRNESQPLFVTIVGEKGDTFSQDHNYYGGETLRRRIAAVNDTPDDLEVSGTVELKADGKTIQTRKLSLKVKQGEIAYAPFSFTLPKVSRKTSAQAVMKMAGRTETLELTLFPPRKPPVWKSLPRIGIVGKNGIAAKAGITGKEVDLKGTIPSGIEVLIIERNCLAPDINARALSEFLARGGRILVMEQNDASLLHYRARELRLEHGFIADPSHPVTAGLDDRDLANWRGRADSVPSEKRPSIAFRHSQSTSLDTPHLTNRNLVAAYAFSDPVYGSIHPVITGGFDRDEALVLEARSGKGKILFCQFDVTPRYGLDPAATILADNLLKAVLMPLEKQLPGVRYHGDNNGKAFLERLGIAVVADSPVGVLGKGGDPAKLAGCRDIVLLPESDLIPPGIEMKRSKLFLYSYPRYWNASTYQFERLKGKLPGTDFPRTAGEIFAGTAATDFFLFSNPELKTWHLLPGTNGKTSRYGTAGEVRKDNIRYIFCGLNVNQVKTGDEREKIYRVWSVIFNNLKVVNQYKIPFAAPATDLSLLRWDFVTDSDGKGEASGFARGNFGGRKVRKLITGKIWEDQGVTESTGKNPADSGYDGYGWYFTEIDLPKMPAGKSYFHVGGIRDISTFNRTDQRSDLYLNGKKMSPPTEVQNARGGGRNARVWTIDNALLKPGKNTIAIRIYNQIGAGGIHRNPVRFEKDGKNPDLLFPYEYRETKYSNYFFWSW